MSIFALLIQALIAPKEKRWPKSMPDMLSFFSDP